MRILGILLAMLAGPLLFAQSISTVGNFFQPALLTVPVGANISLNIGFGHTMTEVTQATWNANGSASNGGFNYPSGIHILNLTLPGIYYYVCQTHAFSGMKGRIVVESSTEVAERAEDGPISIFPNPAGQSITVSVGDLQSVTLRLIDAQGREVLTQRVIGTTMIDVSHLAKGSYTAMLHDMDNAIAARRQLTITR